jgi:CRISPR-associated protein Csb2
MFAVIVDLLAGRYVATAHNDRDRAEWPPHPARLFSALVSTWSEGEPTSEDGARELQTLRWLEQEAAPLILASGSASVGLRDVVPVFVPVNDTFTVSSPDSARLHDAMSMLSATRDPKAKSKAEDEVAKLRTKLMGDTARAIAAPLKYSKEAIATADRVVLADRRTRQPRTFPSATPEEPSVCFVWPDANLPAEMLPALERLLGRVVRLGHSSTLVRAAIAGVNDVAQIAKRTTRFVPDRERGRLVIRWVTPGQAERLSRAFELHRETEPRVLPAHPVRYVEGEVNAGEKVAGSVFGDDFLVLARVGGPRLPITSVAGLSRQLRRALMSVADEPVDEMLSGHRADGSASEFPHLAVVPLPFVGHQHADGALMGVALMLPRGCDALRHRAVLKAVASLEQGFRDPTNVDVPIVQLLLGDAGVLELQRIAWGEPQLTALKSSWWSRPSRWWASVTPVALDRNPGNLHDPDPARRASAFAAAEATIRAAVLHAFPDAAPSLSYVEVVRSCVVAGTAKPRSYPRFPIDAKRPQRLLVHVRLVFDHPVRGPLLLGAGRYQGLGLFLPVDEGNNSNREMPR